MADIRLFINNQEADLNGAESAIAITYRFSDLSAPDQITDTYSKTLTLPGTKNNNAIFAQGWHLQSLMVPTFNASLRNTFRLTVNSNELYSGYIKLNRVTLNNKVYSYDVTLYGEITSYMNALSEITLINAYKNSSTPIEHILTPDYVSESWDNGANSNNAVIYVPCNNGQYDDFDTGKELQYDNGAYSIGSSKYWVDSKSYDFDANEWQRSEFRATKQRPALQVLNLMNTITSTRLNDINTTTGLESTLDGHFSDSFYDENPYCQNSVMTLPLIDQENISNTAKSQFSSASIAQVINGRRYNTFKYELKDEDSTETYSSTSSAPYGSGKMFHIQTDYFPIIDVMKIFDEDSSSWIDFSSAANYIEDSSIYTVQIEVDAALGLGISPIPGSSMEPVLNALFFNNVAGIYTGYLNNDICLNFFKPGQLSSFSTYGWAQIVPYITFNGTSYYAMDPYYGSINYDESTTRYSDFTGPEIFRCYGSGNDVDSWYLSSGNRSATVRFPLVTTKTGINMVNCFESSAGVNIAPWDGWKNSITFDDELVYNMTENKSENYDTATYTGQPSMRLAQYMAKPTRWIHRVSMAGAMLKSYKRARIDWRVWKPSKISLYTGPSAMADDVARAKIVLQNAGYDPGLISTGTMYSLDYILNVYMTSLTFNELPTTCNNNRPSPIIDQQIGYNQNSKNAWEATQFTGYDIQVNGIVPPNAIIVTPDLILDSETTCKDILTSFTKIFGLIYDEIDTNVVLDNSQTQTVKRINICTRNEYFNDYKILDWSDKVDWSQSVEIEPVVMSTKWLSMKFNSSDTYYEKKYDNKYGFEYGEARINTGYQFNTDTEELFKDTLFNNTVISSEFNWFYKPNDSGQYIRDSANLPPCPAYFDKDNGEYKSVDTKFNFLFDNGLMKGDSEGTGGGTYDSSYYITQDSSLMFSLEGGGKACWYAPSTINNTSLNSGVVKDRYRYYSTYMNEDPNYGAPYSWDFAKPQENYQGITDAMYPENCTIYGRYWRRYIEEIYNVNNKKVTMYIYLTPDDMASFSFKNFVTIDGVLFHVNQITDYSPASIRPVQVELITVEDILAYTDGQDIWGQPSDTNAQAYYKSRNRSSMKVTEKNTKDSSM